MILASKGGKKGGCSWEGWEPQGLGSWKHQGGWGGRGGVGPERGLAAGSAAVACPGPEDHRPHPDPTPITPGF